MLPFVVLFLVLFLLASMLTPPKSKPDDGKPRRDARGRFVKRDR